MAVIGWRRMAALVVVLVMVVATMVAVEPGTASALQDPCEVVAGGDPIECDPTATPDPCQVKSAGIDPCDPDPCEFEGEGKGPDPCATETPTPDPCEIVSSGTDPCASPSATPEPTSTATPEPTASATAEPTEESCTVAVVLDTALGGDDCETPEVDETPTFGPGVETETPAPSATETPTFQETVTSLPSTGLGQGAGPAQQPSSTVPLLLAVLLTVVAAVGTLTRRRSTR